MSEKTAQPAPPPSDEPEPPTPAASAAKAADDGRRSRWEFLKDDILEPAAFVATALGVIFGVYQLSLSRQDRRVDATLDFARRFNDKAQIGASRALLERRWWSHEAELKRFREMRKGGEGPSAAVLQAFANSVVLGGNTDQRYELQAVVGELAGFFDQVELCVSEGRCDTQLTAAYFCSYAENFEALYLPTIKDVRETFGNVSLGKGLETFAETRCRS